MSFKIKEDVSDYELDSLMEFIESNFHTYFNENLSVIETRLHAATKVDFHAVDNIADVFDHFIQFKDYLKQHIGEEHFIVFPLTFQLLNDTKIDSIDSSMLETVFKNIEMEHQKINKQLLALEKYATFFDAPASASPTLKECYSQLKQLHHQYTVYLFIEINYLYPKLKLLKQQLLN